MSVRVRIPAPLRTSADSEGQVDVEASDIAGLLQELERRFPGIGERLRDEEGHLRRLVGIYVNGENIHFLSGLDTPLRDGDEVSIVPVVTGGFGRMNPRSKATPVEGAITLD
ncbi:MAG TPA: MoaD/ThiS family protein [Anaerolineae bacterium]|nr:MoaD/ThiS family protein [Anaerolineae bacterium]